MPCWDVHAAAVGMDLSEGVTIRTASSPDFVGPVPVCLCGQCGNGVPCEMRRVCICVCVDVCACVRVYSTGACAHARHSRVQLFQRGTSCAALAAPSHSSRQPSCCGCRFHHREFMAGCSASRVLRVPTVCVFDIAYTDSGGKSSFTLQVNPGLHPW